YPPVTEFTGSLGGVIEELGGRTGPLASRHGVKQHRQRHQDASTARLTSRPVRVRTCARRHAAACRLTPTVRSAAVLWRDRLALVVQPGQDGTVQQSVADHDVLT